MKQRSGDGGGRRDHNAAARPSLDHVRGWSPGRVIVEYGDYECPYSRQAFREIERLERGLGEELRSAFRHFPLTEIHPHALAASAAAEAAASALWEALDR